MADDKEVLFSSFMAGLLLCRNNVTYKNICDEISNFQNHGYNIIEPNGDFNKLSILLDENISSFTLKYDYTDKLGNITVYDYLYSITSTDVRKYFNIPEKEAVKNNIVIRKKTIFDRIKRNKAIARL